MYGSGNSYTAEFWQYDPRLGRRWNVDPMTDYSQSPYRTFNNNPVYFSDPTGAVGEPARKANPVAIQAEEKLSYVREYELHTFSVAATRPIYTSGSIAPTDATNTHYSEANFSELEHSHMLTRRLPEHSELDNQMIEFLVGLTYAFTPLEEINTFTTGYTPDGYTAGNADYAVAIFTAGLGPGRNSKTGTPKGRKGYVPPKTYKNQQNFWTNGKYRLDSKAQVPHTNGNYTAGKSQFKYGLNSDQLVLDAAAYADEMGLWVGNKAKVFVNDGVVGYSNGQPTQWVNIYRSQNGMVHGAPTNTPGLIK